MVLIAWDAVNEQVPDDSIVTESPDVEQTDGVFDVIVGAIFDVADAETLNGVADHARSGGSVNEMVFAAR